MKFLFLTLALFVHAAVGLEKTSCEHKDLKLSCETGKINIHEASYGRHDKTTCQHKAMSDQNCHAAKSKTIVRKACQGKKDCIVKSSNGVFGDPCRGTFKYLKVKYSCDRGKNAVACEHKDLNLKCDAGSALHIFGASYGRHNGDLCKHRAMGDRNCNAAKSMEIVREKCHGKQSCSVKASNGVFGDPCVGTFKYLSVNYMCRNVNVKKACEHEALALTCETGKIDILKASYGRHDGETCKHSAMGNRDCDAKTSMQIVRKACQGKQSCSVKASNGVFGDPCVGTFKYLQVSYMCNN